MSIDKRMMRNIIYGITTVATIAIFLVVFSLNNPPLGPQPIAFDPAFNHYMEPNQYNLLADALLDGRLSLDLPVAEELKELDNPYDYAARYELARDGAVQIFWDHAYYDGAYYCYFGVAPAVLLFAPYKLITGSDLGTSLAVAVLGVAAIVTSSLLIIRIVRRFFSHTETAPLVVLCLLMMFAGGNVLYLGFAWAFYSIPILFSYIVTALGLWFWMGARRESGHGVRLSRPMLAAGSCCMALNLGCRPQFVLACFTAFPLFWREITQERLLFSRRSIGTTAAALLPAFAVFAPLLWYNAARFGSPFDFGSSYNLTSFDMTAYHQKPIGLAASLYIFLLQPLHLTESFPYIASTSLTWPFELIISNPFLMALLLLPVIVLLGVAGKKLVTAAWAERGAGYRRPFTVAVAILCGFLLYVAGSLIFDVFTVRAQGGSLHEALGTIIVEPMFGGYLWLCPFVLILAWIPKVKPLLTERRLWGTCITLLALAATVMVVDARTVGANQRYFSDFAWYTIIVAIIVMCAMHETCTDANRATARKGPALLYGSVSACLLVSMLLGGASFFSPDRFYSVASGNPELFEQLSSSAPTIPIE